MPEQSADIEERLRAHLARVAEHAAPAGMEERIIDHVHQPRRAGWEASFALALVIVAAVTLLVLLTTGHQVNNVFSNISNGLNN